MAIGPFGREDVKYWQVNDAATIPTILPGGRAPQLLADSIQPVVVLGDGKASDFGAANAKAWCYHLGGTAVGSAGVGVPYCEFAAPKAPPSPLVAKIVGGIAQFLDSYLPAPLISQTLSPGTTNIRTDRVCIVDDVAITIGTVSGGTAMLSVGFHSTTVGTFRAVVGGTGLAPSTAGNRPFAAASSFNVGALANGVPVSSTANSMHATGEAHFDFTNGAGQTLRPFAHLTPFVLAQDQIITMGQTGWLLGPGPGTGTNLSFTIQWREFQA